MRIAVASRSGTEVDQHFGHAERFLIYEVGEGGAEQVGEVEVEKYCSFDPEHPTRHDLLHRTIAALAGCRAVVTAMIGDAPRQELRRAGIEAVRADGPIGQALSAALHAVSGCACGRSAGDCTC